MNKYTSNSSKNKRSYEELSIISSMINASIVIFGVKRKEERDALTWSDSQRTTWKNIMNILHDETKSVEDRIIESIRVMREYELFEAELNEEPKDYDLPGNTVYKVSEKTAKSNFDFTGKISDVEIDEKVTKDLKECEILSKKNGISGTKGCKNPMEESTYKSRISSITSINRGKDLSETYIVRFILRYTELYNQKFNTSFELHYSKPSRKNATKERLNDYRRFSEMLKKEK